MHTLVIYDSKFGNTEKIAAAIGRGVGALGDVLVLGTAEAAAAALAEPDLLLLGGPTQKRGASPGLRAFLSALPPVLAGVPAAAFDTRYRGATWLMGSAAAEAAKALGEAGAELVAPPESFFMSRKGRMEHQQLEPGELDRAEQWARTLPAAAVAARAA